MSKTRVCIVCFANYCRSPVAEAIINSKYEDEVIATSAGIHPLPQAGMDRRSSEFLKSINVLSKIHNPKKLTKDIVNLSDLVLAVDFNILLTLNKSNIVPQKKLKMLNFMTPKIQLPDPYRMDIEEYFNVMKNINKVCENIIPRELLS